MPQIPEYTRQVRFPVQFVSPGKLAEPFEALGAFGERIEKVAEIEQNAIRQHKAFQIENGIDDRINQFATALKQRTDYEKYDEDLGKFITDIRAEFGGMASGDRDLSVAVDRYLHTQSRHLENVVRAKKLQDINVQTLDEFSISKVKSREEYATEPSLEKREILKNEFAIKVHGLYLAHHLTFPEMQHEIQTFGEDAEKARAIVGIHSDKPEVIKDTLDQLTSGKFPALGATETANLVVHGQNRLDTLNAKIEAEADRQKITAAYRFAHSLATDNSGNVDYNFMGRMFANPEFQSNYKLTPQNMKSLDADLNAEEGRFNKEKKDRDEKAIDELLPRIDRNKLSYADVHDLVNKGQISRRAGNILETEIRRHVSEIRAEVRESRAEARYARTEARLEAQEKSDAIFGLVSAKIINGIPVDTMEIYGDMQNGLTWKQANELVRMNKEPANPDFKLGVSVIDDAFNNKVINAPTRGKAILDLQEAMKRDKLTGKAIIDKANEIVHPKVEHWYEGLLDKVMGFGETAQPTEKEIEPMEPAVSHVSGQAPKTKPPAVGTVEKGHRFKGGDPSDSKNWEKVKK